MHPKKFREPYRNIRFNSLQTGKCIQRRVEFGKQFVRDASFNSLQTGKCIQSCKDLLHRTVGLYDLFQFPSNGKVYSEESLQANHLWAVEFQFPSNGKVDSEAQKTMGQFVEISFNSLQTGKWIQRIMGGCTKTTTTVSIPFKRESGFRDAMSAKLVGTLPQVSIPFKRESGFRVALLVTLFAIVAFRFNSLQTGKWIQRKLVLKELKETKKFQFPSNGKVDSEVICTPIF